jgi:hypothetical protein
MANTTTVLGRVVEITGLDSNWVWSTDLPEILRGMSLLRVRVKLSAATDVVVLRSGSTSGPRIFQRDNVGQTQCMAEFGPSSGINPAIAIADCTFGTAANAIIMLEFGP